MPDVCTSWAVKLLGLSTYTTAVPVAFTSMVGGSSVAGSSMTGLPPGRETAHVSKESSVEVGSTAYTSVVPRRTDDWMTPVAIVLGLVPSAAAVISAMGVCAQST